MKRRIREFFLNIKPVKYYIRGKILLTDKHFREVQKKTTEEYSKNPSRSDIINYLLSLNQKVTNYLEIGVRNPIQNFDRINASNKYGVDPGFEYDLNPVDFSMTSDTFFNKLSTNEILSNEVRFDVIFIDGLHLAEQVDKDIYNALKYIQDDGFIVLHDCNPPTEWHARENHRYWHSPALDHWNGTTWKAFLKWRCSPLVNSCCIDSDWGVGIISKNREIGKHIKSMNPFFEFNTLNKYREESLNLIDFETFKKMF